MCGRPGCQIIEILSIMGVSLLRTFLDHNHPSSFCSTADVATLARQYRADTGRAPEVVVDANNVMYIIYSKHKYDWLMGGQLKECIAEINKFIDKFANIGVHLIFYFDGATPSTMRDKWVTRRTQRLNSIKYVFDHLKRRARNLPSRTVLAKNAVQPPLVGATSRYMVKYACAQRADVRIACEDGDMDIAAFAKQVPCIIRNIMTGKQFESTTSLEDLTSPDLPSAAQAYKTLRRRTYGILLREKPGVPQGRNATVEEWCIYGMQELTFEHVDIIPVHASTVHPGLLALMTDFTSPEVRDQRWRLFVTTMSEHLDSALVRKLPPRLLVPTCVLYYIQHHATGTPLLYDWELAAFLVTAVEVDSTSVDNLCALPHDPAPPPRAVDVANLFARGVSVTHVLLAACGYNLEQFMPWHFYDGKLFLQNYLLLGRGRRQFDVSQRHSRTQVQEFEIMKKICQ